jgi:hypothetical protein
LPLSGATGVFWFLAPQSLEIVVKIVDGRQLNGHFWVFVAGLSNLAYTATVTDTATGESRTYVHRAGGLWPAWPTPRSDHYPPAAGSGRVTEWP